MNQYRTDDDSYWVSTSYFSPIVNTSYGSITLRESIYVEFKLIFRGLEIEKSGPYEGIFRIGAQSANIDDCTGHATRYPALYLDRSIPSSPSIQFSISNHIDCWGVGLLNVSLHNIEINKIYLIKIKFNQTWSMIKVNDNMLYNNIRHGHTPLHILNTSQDILISDSLDPAANITLYDAKILSYNNDLPLIPQEILSTIEPTEASINPITSTSSTINPISTKFVETTKSSTSSNTAPINVNDDNIFPSWLPLNNKWIIIYIFVGCILLFLCFFIICCFILYRYKKLQRKFKKLGVSDPENIEKNHVLSKPISKQRNFRNREIGNYEDHSSKHNIVIIDDDDDDDDDGRKQSESTSNSSIYRGSGSIQSIYADAQSQNSNISPFNKEGSIINKSDVIPTESPSHSTVQIVNDNNTLKNPQISSHYNNKNSLHFDINMRDIKSNKVHIHLHKNGDKINNKNTDSKQSISQSQSQSFTVSSLNIFKSQNSEHKESEKSKYKKNRQSIYTNRFDSKSIPSRLSQVAEQQLMATNEYNSRVSIGNFDDMEDSVQSQKSKTESNSLLLYDEGLAEVTDHAKKRI